MFNTELANRALDYIRENPGEWNQDDWQKCFAGHVVKLSERFEGGRLNGSYVYDRNDTYLGSIRGVASEELGLEPYSGTAGDLFAYSNTLEDLERKVAALSETVV